MKFLRVILFLFSIALNFYLLFLLLFEKETPQDKQIEFPVEEYKQIKAIAIAGGVDSAAVQKSSPLELLSDIKSVFVSARPFYGKALTQEEWKTLNGYLDVEKDILKKIKRQDDFILSLKDKKIIVIPDKKDEL